LDKVVVATVAQEDPDVVVVVIVTVEDLVGVAIVVAAVEVAIVVAAVEVATVGDAAVVAVLLSLTPPIPIDSKPSAKDCQRVYQTGLKRMTRTVMAKS